MKPERAIAYRKQAGALLEGVILDELSAKEALNCWPWLGNEDTSVQCAYTMLWYFEADEDRHHEELFYADIQLQTLKEALTYLNAGQPLPEKMIRSYRKQATPPEYTGTWTWRQPLLALKTFMKLTRQIIESNPWLNHK